nr:MAG TPA: hypothetical protein [Caudoviricetes sp.]
MLTYARLPGGRQLLPVLQSKRRSLWLRRKTTFMR